MTAKEILGDLKTLGTASYKKTLMKNYGAKEPCFGVKIGPVTAHLGDNQGQIPFAPDYVRKVQKRGTIGKKRKTAKCGIMDIPAGTGARKDREESRTAGECGHRCALPVDSGRNGRDDRRVR